MDHIETKILNSYTIQEAAQNMVFAARLTQQGHSIQNMDDLMAWGQADVFLHRLLVIKTK